MGIHILCFLGVVKQMVDCLLHIPEVVATAPLTAGITWDTSEDEKDMGVSFLGSLQKRILLLGVYIRVPYFRKPHMPPVRSFKISTLWQ